jgi:D-beta-D-heptose 7-phosphate kinase / D-beta-D-heptose 1-phosphate adenosyltransferase
MSSFSQLHSFKGLHVCVIGDVMLDRYWYGKATRISPEAPVPVLNVNDVVDRPGGAANVAINLNSLGLKVTLFSVVGDDLLGKELTDILVGMGISCHLFKDKNKQTTLKLRMIESNQQLLRADFEAKSECLSKFNALEVFEKQIKSFDSCIFSDYDKGAIDDMSSFVTLCRQHKIPTLADIKVADGARYKNVTIIKPNLKELTSLLNAEGMQTIDQKSVCYLMCKYNWQHVIATLGKDGIAHYSRDAAETLYQAKTKHVYDVTGAGDTVAAVIAAFVSAKVPLSTAIDYANYAAGIVISKSGTASVSLTQIKQQMKEKIISFGVVSVSELVDQVSFLQSMNETIVFTNGCFDLLHPGHVRYLRDAKKLGDRLVVAINDDASVTELKGEGRPVNSCAVRMEMMAAIKEVDWVILFSELTPLNVIKKIKPDVLVKGGDYDPSTIVGADILKSYGGEVHCLNFYDGHSTSKTINKISSQKETESEAELV